jgi:pyridoxine 4-dehydrogenase
VGNREYLRQCAFLSARGLGLEQIDLYYLQSGNATNVPFDDQVGTLAELRTGVIRRIGLYNVSADQLRGAQEIVDIGAVTALYNIGERARADLLAAAEDAGVTFSPWHPTAVPNAGRRLPAS